MAKIKSITKSTRKNPSQGFYPATGFPIIDDALRDTRGFLVYQESLMTLFSQVCDITFGQADNIRRITAKKYDMSDPKQAKVILDAKEQWMTGCANYDIPKSVAESFWNKILASAGYMFNKSHAICYAILTYKTLWYRLNYPTEFIVARMSIKPGEMGTWLKTASTMGVTILPPHVNESEATKATIVVDDKGNKAIRLPLSIVKGMGQGASEDIVKNRPYEKYSDFGIVDKKDKTHSPKVTRKKVTSAKVYALFMMGALEGLDGDKSDIEAMTQREIKVLANGSLIVTYKKKPEVFRGTADLYRKFLTGAVIFNEKLGLEASRLESLGYKVGVVSKVEASQTKSGKGNLKIYFGGNKPELYIGDWQYAGVKKALHGELEDGMVIAYLCSKKYGIYLEDDNITDLTPLLD